MQPSSFSVHSSQRRRRLVAERTRVSGISLFLKRLGNRLPLCCEGQTPVNSLDPIPGFGRAGREDCRVVSFQVFQSDLPGVFSVGVVSWLGCFFVPFFVGQDPVGSFLESELRGFGLHNRQDC